jgi:hypothetical protein
MFFIERRDVEAKTRGSQGRLAAMKPGSTA